MSLRDKVFSAARWNVLLAGSTIILRVARVAILARLLVPEDYGLMALVGVVFGFAGLFKDFGLNSAFIQRQNISHNERSTLYWANILLALSLTIVVCLFSPILATFFNDQRLAILISITAINITIGAFGAQIRMAAQKNLNFKGVVKNDFSASWIGFVVAVLGAWLGYGVYALVASTVAETLAVTVFAWCFLSEGWRPALRLKLQELRSFINFGAGIMANNMIRYLSTDMDMLIGGRMLGASQLGLMSVPRNLVFEVQGLVNPIVTRIGFPLIAKVQDDLNKVRQIYIKTINMTASVNAPVYLGAAAFAPDIIPLLLGPGWETSIKLLQILALWGALRTLANPVGSLLLGLGLVGRAFKWNLAVLFVVPPSLWFGSSWGVEGLAYSLLACQAFLYLPSWYFLIRFSCQASFGEYAIASLRPMLLAVFSVGPAVTLAAISDVALVRLVIGGLVAGPLYVMFSYWMNREWVYEMSELVGIRPKFLNQ